ncbi:sugar phosphate isomerase/epimerase family protein [Streptomyces iranensis]|uniref:Sugar phosphate isomerase/epimerase n=1 Tax=Streptomyces iranensis TaxID=576784 RepID=A0A060ZZM3_9ACTN|nr:sugar phosphate isomerase/epimerase family protein [Streptomyces iranensis]MBP2060118.1 sugar phosphate isomerase/epimerase [Streptomyces iranensis]CDR13919.1 Xylose isomerase domain-containing protein TIMbarrel [Streptomyces iranensis]
MSFELSLNQATTRPYALPDTARAAADAGIRHLGLWVEPVLELGVPATVRLLEETGLRASSVCRVGFVADKEGERLRTALDDVRRALDLSAAVGAPSLTFIAGALPAAPRDLRLAEARVRDALETLEAYARATGVRLALEPIHPLFVTSRSAVTTIRQALRIVADLPADTVGILLDAYATFWDPDLRDSVREAGERIAGYQVNDFALPLPGPENMNGRLLPGEGEIDLRALTRTVAEAGYRGPIEVEVFNDDLWAQPLETIVMRTVRAFERAVTTPLADAEAAVS